MTKSPYDVLAECLEEQTARLRRALDRCVLKKVAEATGLHYNTILDIHSGKRVNPSIETVKKLSDYLFTSEI